MAVLIEDLDAIVLAVADKEAPLRIKGQRVRTVEFAATCSFLAPRLEELTVRIEFHDARIGRWFLSVAVGDKDVAIGGNRHFGWLIESVQPGSRDAGFSASHQNLAVLIEFENLLALAIFEPVVGNPQIAVPIRSNFVRADEQSFAKTLQELPRGIEFENWVKWRPGAVRAA